MKRDFTFLAIILIAMFLVAGCQQKPEQSSAPTLKEETSSNVAVATTPQVTVIPQGETVSKPTQPIVIETTTETEIKGTKEESSSEGFAKPTTEEIQQALKNAGFYEGKVDGKIGIYTKKAIKDFQAKNNLEVDGRVGPNTWNKLKEYLKVDATQGTSVKD